MPLPDSKDGEDKAVTTRLATIQDLDDLVPLFDSYRQFYRQPSDMAAAKRFLRDRFRYNQSIIFIASKNGCPAGFTQLYPSFSSGSVAQIFILNDLFVVPEVRRSGIGSALLACAADYARRVEAVRLVLSTELSNVTAQALYERCGWERDSVFCVYTLNL